MKKLVYAFCIGFFFSVSLAIADNGLVAHWKLDGDATDSVGNADGVLVDGTWSENGVLGGAIEFDGLDDSIHTPGISGHPLCGEFTISAWIYPESFSGYRAIYNNDPWITRSVHFQTSGSVISMTVNGGADYVNDWSAANAALNDGLNQWYHVAGTYSISGGSGKCNIFINGIDVAEAGFHDGLPTAIDLSQTAYIGKWSIDRYFDGLVDDLRIYNRVLSDAEIELLAKDTDNDGIADLDDNCPDTFNPDQSDLDADRVGDVCDDDDNDGVLDIDDNCPNTPNSDQADSDQDGYGDVCDAFPNDPDNDIDGDGIGGDIDNCPDTFNPDQFDTDQDGIGDECDLFPFDPDNDIDDDGVGGDVDNCTNTPNTDQSDIDGDGFGDVCDNCPLTYNPDQTDIDGNGTGDVCEGIEIVVDWDPANTERDFEVIQDAIDYARNGQSIIVMDGEYFENINLLGKAITLRSFDPNDPNVVADTIINGNQNGSVIICGSGEGPDTAISGFTIANGSGTVGSYSTVGGGMYIEKSSPKIINCTFTNNIVVGYGGGMYVSEFSSPIINNCSFIRNMARYGGGLLNSYESSPVISNCIFKENIADDSDGGGMCNWDSAPKIELCSFINNIAVRDGGGMNNDFSLSEIINCTFSGNEAYGEVDYYDNYYINGGGAMSNYYCLLITISNCTFSDNIATSGGGMVNNFSLPMISDCTFKDNKSNDWGGGAICNSVSSGTVINCGFYGNIATDNVGGGILNYDSNTLIIANSIFNGNAAKGSNGKGGGMCSYGCLLTLNNCTFTSNICDKNGGGVYSDYCVSKINNCILLNNFALESGQQLFEYQEGPYRSIISYCNIGGCGGSGETWDSTLGIDGGGNIDTDPMFTDIDGIDGIAGTTDDDLSLAVGSPCIDAGTNEHFVFDTADLDNDDLVYESLPFDIIGNSRNADDPVTDDSGSASSPLFPGMPIIDMGAYEYPGLTQVPSVPGDLNGDGKVDIADFAILAANWLTGI